MAINQAEWLLQNSQGLQYFALILFALYLIQEAIDKVAGFEL